MTVFGLQSAGYRGALPLARRPLGRPDRNPGCRRGRRSGQHALSLEQAAGAAIAGARGKRQARWPADLVRAVEQLRGDFPMWGKAKLGPLLRTEGFAASDSTVGRILAHSVRRGVVEPAPLVRRRVRRGHRPKRRHALRLPKGMKASAPGALVQLDTLTVNPTGERTIKQFTAYDPVSRFTVARAFRRATSQAAAQFLDQLIATLPFPVTGIQVDGGSEFMAAFEESCQAKSLDLYVLPPKSPELNGGVERANASWRYELYRLLHTCPTNSTS